MGGGFEIALACDLIIASENAVFALPEPRVGLAALAGGLHRLPRQIGLKRAMGMILTGRRVSARGGRGAGLRQRGRRARRADGGGAALGGPDLRVQPDVDPRLEGSGADGPGRTDAGSRHRRAERAIRPWRRCTAQAISRKARSRLRKSARRSGRAAEARRFFGLRTAALRPTSQDSFRRLADASAAKPKFA